MTMRTAADTLFARYQRFFMDSLGGHIDPAEIDALYAPEFIAASPSGIRAGRRDADFTAQMQAMQDNYRTIGTQVMQLCHVRVTQIDDLHGVGHVGWRAVYARDDLSETMIDFEVHYLIQMQDGAAKVFGWISGDETAALRDHGVI